MGMIKNGYRLYQEKGKEAVAAGALSILLRRSAFSDPLESLLGKEMVEKLVNWFKVGYWPHIENPRSFNEKVMNRKLYTDNCTYSDLECKWTVRDYVRETVGEEVLTEVYHVTDDPETIPFEDLPDEFVVKPTNGAAGEVTIVDDKYTTDHRSIKSKCRDWLSTHHGANNNEYWYGQIEPRVLIEERLTDNEHDVPLDYKFFVFNGRVEYIQVDHGRFSDHSRRFYDRNWTAQEFELRYPLGPEIEEPEQFSEMIAVAEHLGDGFDFLRVDLYQPNGEEVVFGEITIGPGSGCEPFIPVEYDFKLGSLW
jgi:hypothetical protein